AALAHLIAADGELRIAGGVADEVVACHLVPFHADDGAVAALGDEVAGDRHMAGARRHRDADAAAGAAHDIAGHAHVALVFAGADADAHRRRVLDDVAGDGGVGLDRDADTGGVRAALRPLRAQAADEVALDDGEAAAVVEVGGDDAERRAVDRIAGDDGALEIEFGVERDLGDGARLVADHLHGGRGVAAHGGEGATADDVVADDHVRRAEDVDAVAVFAGAAALRRDVLDGVAGDDAAVVALQALPDADAAVAGATDGVAAQDEAAGVGREQGRVGDGSDRVAFDDAVAVIERDAVAVGVADRAVDDAQRFRLRQ